MERILLSKQKKVECPSCHKTIDLNVKLKRDTKIRDGGVFNLTEYDLEQMGNEFAEINNIIGLAKADNGIKALLLSEILNEFGEDLKQHFYDYFGTMGIIRDG